MSTHRPVTILHISDIQVQGPTQLKMLEKMRDDLKELKAAFGLEPQVVVASGDLAETGETDEFNLIAGFLHDLLRDLGLTVQELVIVPGNHDINRKDCVTHRLESPAALPYGRKWAKFAAFFNSVYGQDCDHKFSVDEPHTIFAMPSVNAVFAGFNSTWEETDEVHHGYISGNQIEWFKKRLEPYSDKRWLRIAVLHHNVMFERSDDAALKDRTAFLSRISPHVNMILHGHTHLGSPSYTTVPILPTGSATVDPVKRPPEIPNQYQIIQVWPRHYIRWARSFSFERQEWIGDCSVSIDGNSWHERRPCRFEGVNGSFPRKDDGDWDEAVVGFIQAGDVASALALTEGAESTRPIHADWMSIRQKFGLFDAGNIAQLAGFQKGEDVDAYYRLKVVQLKMHSQMAQLDRVEELYEEIYHALEFPNERKRGVINRHAVALAIRKGSAIAQGEFDESLWLAMARSGQASNEHAAATSDCLRTIASHFCSETPVAHDAATSMRLLQEQYLVARYELRIGEAFPFKSAVQALFAEAAVLLDADFEDKRGWNRLIAANLMISRFVITPLAEGYAELLSMIWHPDHHLVAMDKGKGKRRKALREIIESAMDSSQEKRSEFLTQTIGKAGMKHLFAPMFVVLELIPNQTPKPYDWRAFREFLTHRDDRAEVL